MLEDAQRQLDALDARIAALNLPRLPSAPAARPPLPPGTAPILPTPCALCGAEARWATHAGTPICPTCWSQAFPSDPPPPQAPPGTAALQAARVRVAPASVLAPGGEGSGARRPPGGSEKLSGKEPPSLAAAESHWRALAARDAAGADDEDDEDDLPDESVPWYERQPGCVRCGQPASSRNRRGEPVCGNCWMADPDVRSALLRYTSAGRDSYRRPPASQEPGKWRGWDADDADDEEDAPASEPQETCWLCEDVMDHYDSGGFAWREGCLREGRHWGWQDLLDVLPPEWQRERLAIWAAAAYHFAQRRTLYLPSGFIATGEILGGADLFRRLGAALVSPDRSVSREARDRLTWLVERRGLSLVR